MVIILSLTLIIVSIYAIIIIIKYNKSNKLNKDLSESTIALLQEIAYDYRVRVVKAGYGEFLPNSYIPKEDIDNFIDSNDGDFSMDSEARYIKHGYDIDFDFNEKSKYYIIIYRVFGKCYLACNKTMVGTWSVVIKRARSECRVLFGRTSYLERLGRSGYLNNKI